MHVFGLEPGAEPGVEDFRLALPKVRIQSALNVEMVKLQFDGGNVFAEVSADVGFTNMKSGYAAAFGMGFYDHKHLLFNTGEV
jgi:hypothetical protein